MFFYACSLRYISFIHFRNEEQVFSLVGNFLCLSSVSFIVFLVVTLCGSCYCCFFYLFLVGVLGHSVVPRFFFEGCFFILNVAAGLCRATITVDIGPVAVLGRCVL